MLHPSEQLAKHTYFDTALNCQLLKVLPGEYAIGSGDFKIITVLGSCVSACLHDPIVRIGGMNHFMLPDSADPDEAASVSMRYGGCAMEVLINQLLKAGAKRNNLEAKVFGGGNLLGTKSSIRVGPKNSNFVKTYLETEGIPILAADLDKTWGRKVLFDPLTGKVRVKKVIIHKSMELIKRETNYLHSLTNAPANGSIELF
jgi:chemotaxis protein CheD